MFVCSYLHCSMTTQSTTIVAHLSSFRHRTRVYKWLVISLLSESSPLSLFMRTDVEKKNNKREFKKFKPLFFCKDHHGLLPST